MIKSIMTPLSLSKLMIKMGSGKRDSMCIEYMIHNIVTVQYVYKQETRSVLSQSTAHPSLEAQ
jgi:hypothetical protein